MQGPRHGKCVTQQALFEGVQPVHGAAVGVRRALGSLELQAQIREALELDEAPLRPSAELTGTGAVDDARIEQALPVRDGFAALVEDQRRHARLREVAS